ncbi:hypothetical protein CKAH01_06634 [Colletotrichum kahawae]|uniref:Anaphase-promoting complex, subunit CDC26 n=1 Tax=Colletotrichum kahawae TaxID=34407 RepID=A0AAE0D534_COLKA|nr:hypothetical protein CKAH01_06634 [Colletotrichum kahawae]
MLRRPATTLSITAEDIAAYEDRRAREAMLRERQALIQAQQQQQQQRILQQQQQLPSSSPQRQQPYDPDISAEEYAEYEAHQAELLRRQGEMMRTQQQQQQQPVQRLGQPGRGASVMQTTPGDGGRGGRTREDRIGVGRRGR